MRFHVRDFDREDLSKLNTLTKYPSIPTYHVIDGGKLTSERIELCGHITGTEKVDGTNARIIWCPNDTVLVGSREDLLWERRDLIGNPSMGIVDALRSFVLASAHYDCSDYKITVAYFEVYGHKIGQHSKNYASGTEVGYRLFDVFTMPIDEVVKMLSMPLDKIAAWRDAGGQPYMRTTELNAWATGHALQMVPLVVDGEGGSLPTSLEETYDFLMKFKSQCALDQNAAGVPEGIVVRTDDRKTIVKLRREDYQRALKKRA